MSPEPAQTRAIRLTCEALRVARHFEEDDEAERLVDHLRMLGVDEAGDALPSDPVAALAAASVLCRGGSGESILRDLAQEIEAGRADVAYALRRIDRTTQSPGSYIQEERVAFRVAARALRGLAVAA